MRCPSCNAQVSESASFCSACGTSLQVPCPRCQHRNPATASFCEECGTWIGNRALRSRPSASTQWSNAERRQLTIMFCDLVESVARSIRLDPEDLQRIMRDYYRLCDNVIVRSGGYVAKYLGDGVLAYFGYP
ncbi:MAG: zinc-ribbon domain-containing protein, partial [Acetobacteraceae bacterium]|nr:zinc-ribbon domain-containing protein [Acetobacteraceae bacterium]